MTNGTEPSEAPRRLPRWRRALVATLVILSVVLVPLAGLSVWVRNLVLDTDKYVETVEPLGRNKAITDLVAKRATDRLFQRVDVAAEAKDALPERAQFLAGPLSTGVETFVREAAKRALASEQFAIVWREANRRAHARVVKALTGEGKNVSVKDGKVVLDLSAVIDEVTKRLDERGVTVFDSLAKDQKNLQVELFDAEQLEKARSAVHLLDRARIVLVVLVFVLLGAALALSGNRRRTLMRWGIGLVVAMAVTAALLKLGRSAYLGVAKIMKRWRRPRHLMSGIFATAYGSPFRHHVARRSFPGRHGSQCGFERGHGVSSAGPGARPTRPAGRRGRSAPGWQRTRSDSASWVSPSRSWWCSS
jgi:hypothetical protein